MCKQSSSQPEKKSDTDKIRLLISWRFLTLTSYIYIGNQLRQRNYSCLLIMRWMPWMKLIIKWSCFQMP